MNVFMDREDESTSPYRLVVIYEERVPWATVQPEMFLNYYFSFESCFKPYKSNSYSSPLN